MKRILATVSLSIVAALALGAMPPNLQQQSDEAPVANQDALSSAAAAAQNALDQTQQKLDHIQAQVEKQVAEATAQVKRAEDPTESVAADEATVTTAETLSDLSTRLQNISHRTHAGGRPLIIRSSESDAKEQGNLEEDLQVMLHILDKALEENASAQSRTHREMGIELVFGPSTTPFRSMYLEGYGALFMLRVGLPLLAPPKTEERKEKSDAETNSTWEEARQDLFGHRTSSRITSTPAQPYDEEKVNKLKDSILEALKNASNIHDLKSDDSVTVCLFGSANGAVRSARLSKRSSSAVATAGSSNQDPKVWVFGDGSASPSRGAILTIKVRKGDAESFAKGKLTLDDFRKKAKMTTYLGNTGGTSSGAFGMGGGGGFGTGFNYNFEER